MYFQTGRARRARPAVPRPHDGIYVVDTMGDGVVANNKMRGLLFGVSGRVTVVGNERNGPAMLNRGFTLIEVLVTLVILMFGLLGIAGLMAKGQRVSFEAYQRQQALALANDMAERMRANRTQATAYRRARRRPPLGDGTAFATLSPAATITDCGVATCSSRESGHLRSRPVGRAIERLWRNSNGRRRPRRRHHRRARLHRTNSTTCPATPAPPIHRAPLPVASAWPGRAMT